MQPKYSTEVQDAVDRAVSSLMGSRNREGFWMGMLSSSAVSTSITLIALKSMDSEAFETEIKKGAAWIVEDQNENGGWGDTDRSPSNYPATLLSVAALSLIDKQKYSTQIKAGMRSIESLGGISGISDYYGGDRTFSVPIMAVAALAGLVPWTDIAHLPYEVVLFPRSFLRLMGVPVVSYALPALCAVGMLVQGRNPVSGIRGFLKKKAKRKALRILENLQPESGGYLEAAPLTGFVTASLAHIGLKDHKVVRNAAGFLARTQRDDGSWPIDENLSVWNTSIALQALASNGRNLKDPDFESTRLWYQDQQAGTHVFTESPPGGFPWTHLSGGVPDSDDTGMALVTLKLMGSQSDDPMVEGAIRWCRKIQNRDGGWPTFCRGWGKLPFDRSAVDITSHVLTGLLMSGVPETSAMVDRAVAFLIREQSEAGSWNALWFGNELQDEKQNYTYATSQAIKALMLIKHNGKAVEALKRGMNWILRNQNTDGGWGPVKGVESSSEETAFAQMALIETGFNPTDSRIMKSIQYLLDTQDPDGSWEPTPIGLYFAQLWYYERTYAQAFPLWSLSCWLKALGRSQRIDRAEVEAAF